MVIDLQSHSTISDGALEPGEVVRLAADAGVEVLSLTDHDAVDGVAEASATAEKLGIELIPAVELSTVHIEAEDLHLLGYWVDTGNERLAQVLGRAQADRIDRAERIADALGQQGVKLSISKALEFAGGARSLGRPHLAQAALSEPDNTDLLGGIVDISEFIRTYLIPGKPAFVSRSWPSTPMAVELVAGLGAVPVWAHPFWDLSKPSDVARVLDELVEAGLAGLEVFYPSHDREQTKFLLEQCHRHGLTPTASSDFHGPKHRIFSKFLAYETFGLAEPEVPERMSF